jgi:hypothetical protein
MSSQGVILLRIFPDYQSQSVLVIKLVMKTISVLVPVTRERGSSHVEGRSSLLTDRSGEK